MKKKEKINYDISDYDLNPESGTAQTSSQEDSTMDKLKTESEASIVERLVILPCPFCGTEPIVCEQKESEAHPGNYFHEHVECKTCGVCMTGPDAKTRWNKRAI